MAKYRTTKIDFWEDPYIERLPHNTATLYLYLITSCPSNLGLLERTHSRISFEFKITEAEVAESLDRLKADGKIITDGDYILLVNFIEHQMSSSEKVLVALKQEVKKITSQIILFTLATKYPVLAIDKDILEYPIDTLPIPYAYPTDTKGIGIGIDKEPKDICPILTPEEKPNPKAPKKGSLSKGELALMEEWFNKFYDNYPRKIKRKQAQTVFFKIFGEFPPDKRREYLSNLGMYLGKYSSDSKDKDPQYIMHPSTWLNSEIFSIKPSDEETSQTESWKVKE